MKRSEFIKQIPFLLFCFTLLAFLCFFICINGEEGATVDRAEPMIGYGVFSDVYAELVNDDTAPVGVRKIYKGILPSDLSQEDYLCFNIAHHNIEVYFGGEPVYSLTGSENNRIAGNVSNNWCIVHMSEIHAGKELTVVLTPLFEAAIGKTPEFLLGSPYAMTIDVLVGELSLLILSSVCILLGVFIAAVFLYFRLIEKRDNKGLLYLGFFSISVGLWKLTDLHCMSLLMPEHALVLGYVSVGSLFLTGACLLSYFSTLFIKGKRKVMTALSCAGFLVCLTVFVLQLLGVTEIRQSLVYSHILLIVAIVSIPITALINRIVYQTWGLQKSWKLLCLIFVGIAVDLVFYYRNDRNGLLSFSIMGLIVYTLIIFLTSIQDATRKAYTDSPTGLVNRTRWTELMNKDIPASKPYAVMMVDMNGLKHVNDTLGHEAGDEMILRLSEILRQTLPSSAVICRWGGDEFAVLMTDTNRAHLELQISKLFSESEKYNADHPELPIHFAVGAVISTEHPEASRQELFRLADDEMYRNKKIWYSQQ